MTVHDQNVAASAFEDAPWAFERYEAVRARMPDARYPARTQQAESLSALADAFDVFVLDAYGVLNVGKVPIPGAAARVDELRTAGKQVFVLTNGATFDAEKALSKYDRLGFSFEASDVVASREVASAALTRFPASMCWGVMAPDFSELEKLPVKTRRLTASPLRADGFDAVDGYLLVGSRDWTERHQECAVASLIDNPRPVVVANPDIVAPLEGVLSREPGYFAHDIADRAGIDVEFHGKPFPSVFDSVKAAIRARVGTGARVAMVGDTLHTDILGGAAAGWGTVLVSGFGLFRGRNVMTYIERSGIVPDFVIPKP